MGKRVEENRAEINDILALMTRMKNGELNPKEKDDAIMATFISVFIDISKSLAVIADKF